MYRFGPNELGIPAGLMAAAAVGTTLWFLTVRDRHHERVAAGVCPRCGFGLSRYEETPRPGALDQGIRGWRCDACGLEGAEPLTPARPGP